MICVGIDAGSRAIKIVLIDANTNEMLASGSVEQGVFSDELAQQLLKQLLDQCDLRMSGIVRVVATGYARNQISIANTTVTEITCHGRGVYHLVPDTRTIIEIGGQDSKMLKLDAAGFVRDFAMNDRCAAGTGRFLEMVAVRLGVGLSDMGGMAAQSQNPAIISSMCIVFAETEIIGLLATGTPAEDIVAGVQTSIVTRVASMAGKNITPAVVFTGGVAMVPGMDRALESVVGQSVCIAPNPQMTGALGAALLASEQVN